MDLPSRLNLETIERIRAACPGGTLKPTCSLAGLSYDTLYGQMRHNRFIPHVTVRLLADVTQLPVQFFDGGVENLSITHRFNSSERRATLDNMILAGIQPSIDTMRDWLEQADFELSRVPWINPLIDVFETMKRSDDIPVPYRIGEKSLSRIYFFLEDEADYTKRVGMFSDEKKARLRRSHSLVKSELCFSTTEEIKEYVRGVQIHGRYRRLMARATCEDGQKRTIVYSTMPKLLD